MVEDLIVVSVEIDYGRHEMSNISDLKEVLYHAPEGATHVSGHGPFATYWKLIRGKWDYELSSCFSFYSNVDSKWLPERVTDQHLRCLDDIKYLIGLLNNDTPTTISGGSEECQITVKKTICGVDPDKGIHNASTLCNEMKLAVAGEYLHGDKCQRGLFVQVTSNLQGGFGNRIYLKSGNFDEGIALPTCPFCGGSLMSSDEKGFYEGQVQIYTDRITKADG